MNCLWPLACLVSCCLTRVLSQGLAVSLVSSKEDADVLNGVQAMFEVQIEKLPESLDEDLYFASA